MESLVRWELETVRVTNYDGTDRAYLQVNLYQYSAKKHFQDGPVELQIPIRLRSGQALDFARDDKGEGGAFHHHFMLMDRTANVGITKSLDPPRTALSMAHRQSNARSSLSSEQHDCHLKRRKPSGRRDTFV
jgi:hypothetical protein